jgi:antitoxin component YwqK of YwqJK toxin-antitoxin module
MVNRDEFTGGYNNPRTGKWNYWHSNGLLACTGVHHSDSVWIFWDEEGKKVHECEYRHKNDELPKVWNNLRVEGCSDELINKYKFLVRGE